VRYLALATDYDGTLAHDGRVDQETLESLKKLRESGRKLLLVTGRQLPDLFATFSGSGYFDWIVAENGALLYQPETKVQKVLAEPPSQRLVDALRKRGVEPLAVGDVIVATWDSQKEKVLDAIQKEGIEVQIIFNKGALMMLPSGVNKATGLRAALEEMGLSAHSVVGVGDAENDHTFLSACEASVAVANALPSLKERADLVTSGKRGAGVQEVIARLIENDLNDLRLPRRDITVASDHDRP
jgi:HAD superfamily hydrolase (TIGR01484 family)